MAAVLAPWPFLDGGAAAVQVATIFDGATVEEELLWRGAGSGGHVTARLGDDGGGGGVADVRLGDGGWQVVLARACDGEVCVGARVVPLRELSLCGVTALPIGPRTRVTVRAGMVTFAIAGTTPPRRLPRAAPASWRRRAGIAVAALAVTGFGVALQATAPRPLSWSIPDSVRVKVSLLMPSLHGGRAPSVAEETPAKKVLNRERAVKRATRQPPPPPPATSSSPAMASLEPATARAAASEDDARKAAALQARQAGVVGVLAQSRAAFLGDVHVAGDGSSAAGSASGQTAGSSDGASSGSSDGASSGSSDGASSGSSDGAGALSGEDVGDAYGAGGLGLSGTGEGGGGAGDDAIGIGDIGTIGYGSGSDSGYGYGTGIGDLSGRRASAPVCTLGLADIRGSCDADLIRRVMRAHANELRFCYERVLQAAPALTGRTLTRFVIGVDGRVAAATANGFPEVDACVAAAIRRWQFTRYCAAAVHWPILFVPTEGAP